jgi:hypothetical protein
VAYGTAAASHTSAVCCVPAGVVLYHSLQVWAGLQAPCSGPSHSFLSVSASSSSTAHPVWVLGRLPANIGTAAVTGADASALLQWGACASIPNKSQWLLPLQLLPEPASASTTPHTDLLSNWTKSKCVAMTNNKPSSCIPQPQPPALIWERGQAFAHGTGSSTLQTNTTPSTHHTTATQQTPAGRPCSTDNRCCCTSY